MGTKYFVSARKRRDGRVAACNASASFPVRWPLAVVHSYPYEKEPSVDCSCLETEGTRPGSPATCRMQPPYSVAYSRKGQSSWYGTVWSIPSGDRSAIYRVLQKSKPTRRGMSKLNKHNSEAAVKINPQRGGGQPITGHRHRQEKYGVGEWRNGREKRGETEQERVKGRRKKRLVPDDGWRRVHRVHTADTAGFSLS